ncbi:MAG: substrate-binding protein [Desulfobacterales bacterium]|nr:substrate-binding protein [Desulfobacterales bacterium]
MSKKINRREALKTIGAAVAISATSFGVPTLLKAADTIKIGFMAPLTGFGALAAPYIQRPFELAVEQINAQGGAGGRKLEFVTEDTQSSTKGTIEKTRMLIGRNKVDVLMGLIYSMERKAALTVSIPNNKLLVYPTFYEGDECNRNLICTGQIPNQSIDKFVPWLMQNVGKTVYILGSDYLWPRTCTEHIEKAVKASGGKIVGVEYFPFGTYDFAPALLKVKDVNPDMVWTMVVGSDTSTVIKQYRSFNLKPQLVSNAVDEMWATFMPKEDLTGIISDQSYFMTRNSSANSVFVKAYQDKFGVENGLIPALAEAMYCGTWLYAKAVAKAGSTDNEKVVKAISQIQFDAPQGPVSIMACNNHMRTNSLIGKTREDGLFDILADQGMTDPNIPNCSL